jgi:hypothetical protein
MPATTGFRCHGPSTTPSFCRGRRCVSRSRYCQGVASALPRCRAARLRGRLWCWDNVQGRRHWPVGEQPVEATCNTVGLALRRGPGAHREPDLAGQGGRRGGGADCG